MRSQLKIQISGDEPTATNGDQVWVKLTTDSPEYTSQITKSQLADWLDSAYGIVDHCTGEKSDNAYDRSNPDDTTESRLQSALTGGNCYDNADLLAMHEQCNPLTRSGESKKFSVYVHCSSELVRDSYSFRCSSDVSPSGPNKSGSTVDVVIDFTDAKEVPVYRFAEPEDVSDLWRDDPPQWLGNVLVDNKIYDSSTIGVAWRNGRIVLSKTVSGRLYFRLPIKYDVWNVSVPGTIIGDKRDYSATAYAFHDQLSDPAEIELSDEQEDPAEGSDCDLCGGTDTPTDSVTEAEGEPIGGPCQKRINWELRNSCTNSLVDYGVRYEDSPCPNTQVTEVAYTGAETPEGARYTAEEFEDECCDPPEGPGCLPCKDIYSTYQGGAPVQPSEEYWRNRYAPAQVFFNRVRVEGGGPCGTRTDSFKGGQCDACDNVEAIEYLDDNPDVVAAGSSVTVSIDGGLDEITWTLEGGSGFEFSNGNTKIVSGKAVTIYSTVLACGSVTIVANDGCSEDRGGLSSTYGAWEVIKDTLSGDDLYYTSCEVGGIDYQGKYYKKRYVQDWCNYDQGACTGSEAQVCDKPSAPEPLRRVEGEQVSEWGCP